MASTQRPSVLSLTPSAVERARTLISGAGRPVAGLKLGVKNGGCAGMAYTLDLVDQADPFDEIVESQGVRFLVAPKDLMFLLNTEVDFEATKLVASFTFHNPNQTSSCGCGESISITPVDAREIDKAIL
jgi:iron-sulfur cluster assembly protein